MRRSRRGRCQPRLYLVHLFLRVSYFLLLCRDLIFFIFQLRGARHVVLMLRIAQICLLVKHILPLRNVQIGLKAF